MRQFEGLPHHKLMMYTYSDNMSDILIIVFIGIAIIAGMLGIPYLMMRRAVGRVVKIFQRNFVIDAKSAKTIDELGLSPRTMLQNMFRARDYKPQALNFLMKAEIIQVTEDGKLYLSEEKLGTSRLYRR